MMRRKRLFIAWSLVLLIAFGFSCSLDLSTVWAASFVGVVVIVNMVMAWIEQRMAGISAGPQVRVRSLAVFRRA